MTTYAQDIADLDFAAARFAAVQAELEALSSYWDTVNEPGSFLMGETYPFGQELEEQICAIAASREAIAAQVADLAGLEE